MKTQKPQKKQTQKTTKPRKSEDFPYGIRSLYDHQEIENRILNIFRKQKWYVKAVNRDLPKDEQNEAWQDFGSLLHRVLENGYYIWTAETVEICSLLFLWLDVIYDENEAVNDGWDKIHVNMDTKKGRDEAERKARLYDKYLRSIGKERTEKNVAEINKRLEAARAMLAGQVEIWEE